MGVAVQAAVQAAPRAAPHLCNEAQASITTPSSSRSAIRAQNLANNLHQKVPHLVQQCLLALLLSGALLLFGLLQPLRSPEHPVPQQLPVGEGAAPRCALLGAGTGQSRLGTRWEDVCHCPIQI